MIIKQNVKVRDRKSLQLVKNHLRTQRDQHLESVTRSSAAFRQKWTWDYLVQTIGMDLVPNVIGQGLASLTHAITPDKGTEEGKESPSFWKTLLSEFLEKFIPRVVERMA